MIPRFWFRPVLSPEAYLPTARIGTGFASGCRISASPIIRFGAREYSPNNQTLVQPDPYNFTELSLPEESKNQALAVAELTLASLSRDPSQQYRYGFVSGNPLRWIDPLGLCLTNNSNQPVEYKDENEDVIKTLPPKSKTDDPIDGIKPPAWGGDWYKVPDGTDVTINPDENPDAGIMDPIWKAVPDLGEKTDRLPGWKKEPGFSDKNPDSK